MHHLTSAQLSQQKHVGSTRNLQEQLFKREKSYNPMFKMNSDQKETKDPIQLPSLRQLLAFAFSRA